MASAGAVQETDADDTLLTINVRTISGQQDLSRQVLDRTTGGDSVIIEDLIGAYHEELDRQILFGLTDGIGVRRQPKSVVAELHPHLRAPVGDQGDPLDRLG